MNTKRILFWWGLFSAGCGTLHAIPRSSANYSIAADVVGTGGIHGKSGDYSNDGNVSEIAGPSSAIARNEIAKSGYLGQLYEAAGLVASAVRPWVNGGETVQLKARQVLDDSTFLELEAASVQWGPVAPPLRAISKEGFATFSRVEKDTAARINASFGGRTAGLGLTVTRGATAGLPDGSEAEDSAQSIFAGSRMVDAQGNARPPDEDLPGEANLSSATREQMVSGHLANFSARLKVSGRGDAPSVRFTLAGKQPKNVILRAIGPSLPFADKLMSPALTVFDGNGRLVATAL